MLNRELIVRCVVREVAYHIVNGFVGEVNGSIVWIVVGGGRKGVVEVLEVLEQFAVKNGNIGFGVIVGWNLEAEREFLDCRRSSRWRNNFPRRNWGTTIGDTIQTVAGFGKWRNPPSRR